MNTIGLLPHQPAHAQQVCQALIRYGASLDASDTGTGKTYVALAICRELNIVPLVIGTKNGRAEWERAAKVIGVEIEYINYERVRGRRAMRGGVEVDSVSIFQNSGVLFDTPCAVGGSHSGKTVFQKNCSWAEASKLLIEAGGPETHQQTGIWQLEKPGRLAQTRISESDWIEEKKYGSGSFVVWKQNYTMIIFDEVHRCGGNTSLNSKLLIAAKRQAKFVLTLSASAADNPQQFKALGYALGLHQLNGKFGFRPWLLKHGCVPEADGMDGNPMSKRIILSQDRSVQNAAFRRLNAEIFPAHGARMRKSEIPGFPKSLFQIKLLASDSKQILKLTSELHALYAEYAELAIQTDMWVSKMQALEILMVPSILELVEDVASESRVAIFVSYQATRQAVTEALQKKFGTDSVGWVDGSQVGAAGERQRRDFISRFQKNDLAAIVLNANAGGESVSLHDPEGKIERVSLITPQESGRRLKQLLGRVDRAGGANSVQWLLYFADTEQEKTARRVEQKFTNIELLNDADLRP